LVLEWGLWLLASDDKAIKTSAAEMLSFGGLQFALSSFMAFISYYLMMFLTDVALIPPAATAVFILCYRLFAAIDTQIIGLFINRRTFKDGKYRPYFKWCVLPFVVCLVAFGMTSGVNAPFKVIYAAVTLIICDLCWSAMQTASMSMLPYLANDDMSRTKFMSFSNGSSIAAYILVGTFMLPLTVFLGGGDSSRGFMFALALIAVIAVPLVFNAYFRLKERHYFEPGNKPPLKEVFLAVGRSKRFIIFIIGLCLYFIADAFKNTTAYYYVGYVMGRPELLPMVIMAGLLSPLAMQPVIPRLLKRAKKEDLIVFGLFGASCASLLMLVAGDNFAALIVCVVLYGVFTSIVANLVFSVMASFSDEIKSQRNISMSEILASIMSLGSNISSAVAGGAAALALHGFGYSAQAAVQSGGTLLGIRVLYVVCTAALMLFAGTVFTVFRTRR